MDRQHIASHSHIHTLGLDDKGMPIPGEGHLIGQHEAREAAGLLVDLVKSKKLAGKSVLISGPMGSGKTALAVAISKTLGPRTPFTTLSGSEVYSNEVKKTEILEEALRRSILIRIREVKDVYEGEVVDLQIFEQEDPLKGYTKSVKEIVIALRSSKGSKKLKLSPTLYEAIEKERILVGDVVYIEAGSGIIKRLGRCESHMGDVDLEADQYLPLPKGEVMRRREVTQDVTLHDLDIANAKPTGQDMVSLVSQILSPRRSEITDKLRNEVNKVVTGYLESGNAEIIPGVLFIDEVHMLDIECYSFLHKAIESPISPIIIFATNRAESPIKGAEDILSPFGMPRDLLDRLVIIPMRPNNKEENEEIIRMRIKEENMNVSEDAVARLGEISLSNSLRYSLCLLPLLKTLASSCVEVAHIEEVRSLFIG
ncbi:RuvB-like protein 1 [Astathelohania contejeani]|uniref:RuvB-like helicase n=1 Tax=Astathelohania contejeani TaxID=164912 RepID=A0ABQ7HW85_9MICR|nr:RuvB-like protein 1 [Thelohania contejeani]